jgi:hypothetical protein
MSEQNYRGFYMKMFEADDKNLDFLMKTEKVTNQSDGIRKALAHYKETHEVLSTLNYLLEEQQKTNQVLSALLLKGA